MKSFSVYFVLCLSLSLNAFADIQIAGPVKATSELRSWQSDFENRVRKMKSDGTYPKLGLTECRETVEVARAQLCLSYEAEDMNQSVARASYWAEGLFDVPHGTVVHYDDQRYTFYYQGIGGHDLQKKDLLDFYSQAKRECTTSNNDPQVCSNAYETDYFDNFILPSANQGDMVLITFSLHGGMQPIDVVSHEIMHAQYFLDQTYRTIVDQFWNELTAQDQKSIKQTLGRVYDSSNELLMKNEFQAYILMANADRNMLAGFVKRFRGELEGRLEKAGSPPVQVQ